jgi:pyruvate kinase
MRRAKIVCTIGPASRDEAVLSRLVEAGMDVARLNFSHGTHAEHGEVIQRVRAVASRLGKDVAILLDLSGPKIRLGELAQPRLLSPGDVVTLTGEPVTDATDVLPVRYPHFAKELSPGELFSINDGLINLEVLESDGVRVRARVLSEGMISTNKGVNLPTGGEGLASLTEKDAIDLRFGLKAGVDWVSLSFVRSPSDADAPFAIMREEGRRVPLMAKIEKRQALDCIDGILERFDGLMVARGDLGVEIPLEDLPAAQKMLIRKANLAAKPVVTATQMLLSMVSNPRPTRAEVTDVANAILDGTDAVMLSEETAMGQHPVETVRTMATIADRAAQLQAAPSERLRGSNPVAPTEAIAHATRLVADEIAAVAIVTPTASGATARLVAAMRPRAPILAVSSDPETLRRLAVVWGVSTRLSKRATSTDEIFEICRESALASGFARKGQRVVVTAGVHGEKAGGTNLLQILDV